MSHKKYSLAWSQIRSNLKKIKSEHTLTLSCIWTKELTYPEFINNKIPHEEYSYKVRYKKTCYSN